MRAWRAIFVLLGTALLLHGGARAATDDRPEKPGTLYILAIGIDQYPPGDHSKLPSLKGCKSDATAVADILEKKAAPRYARVDKQVILDADATSDRVEAAINHIISESKPDDTLVFYFAGHATRGAMPGAPRGAVNDFLLAMSNANQVGSGSMIPGRQLKSWLSRVQASRQLVIFDANSSDMAVQVFRSHVEEDSKEAIALANRSLLVMGYEGYGLETADENGIVHGLFTTILLRALSGQADAYPQDGTIRASELEAYVYGAMAEEALKQGALQHPATWMTGSDFSILISDAALARAIRSPQAGRKKVLSDLMRGFATGAEVSGPEAPEMPPVRGYALLIAGDNYDDPSWHHLSNPVFDANALAKELGEGYGFQTQMVTNPKRDDIFAVLREYQKKTFSDEDELLIFIAGHGYFDEQGGDGYVIARDSAPPGDRLPSTAYPFSMLRTAVDNIHAKHILLVLDVCFGGTFDERVTQLPGRGDDEYAEVSKGEFVERKMKYKTRLYLTSGGKEYVGDGRAGEHSPFARHLLEAIRSRGGKEGILTMNKLRPYVEKITPEPRAGEFGHNDPGSDFLFIANPSQSAPPPPKP